MSQTPEFFHIHRTRTKKTQVLLRFDQYDYERLEELPPHDITVQEKLRQMIKVFLEEGDPVPAKENDDDLEGL